MPETFSDRKYVLCATRMETRFEYCKLKMTYSKFIWSNVKRILYFPELVYL